MLSLNRPAFLVGFAAVSVFGLPSAAQAGRRVVQPKSLADYGFDAEHIALAKSPQQVLHPGIVVMNVLFKS
jgi:hypothetical protein